MYRRVLITLAFVVGAIAAGSSLTSASAPTGIALAQDTETPPVQPVEHLLLGERYSSDAWEIEVQDAFVADSIDRAAYVEVRASVAFRNLGGAPVPYEWAALTGMRGFPKLQIVDQEGVIYPIDAGEAGNTLLPGSNLVSMEPYVPARWTIGFEVNGPQSSALSIEALWDEVVVAEWDVYSEPRPVEGWSAPPDAEVVDATTSRFDWTDSVGISSSTTERWPVAQSMLRQRFRDSQPGSPSTTATSETDCSPMSAIQSRLPSPSGQMDHRPAMSRSADPLWSGWSQTQATP